MTVHLEPGRFYAGVSLPFFVTEGMVAHKLEGLGFTNVTFHARDLIASLKVDPKKYPGYDDGWNQWIEADYTGPKKDLEFEKHWSWLLVVPTPMPQAVSATPIDPGLIGPLSSPKAGSPALAALGVVLIVIGLFKR